MHAINTDLISKECLNIINTNLQSCLDKTYKELKAKFKSQLKDEIINNVNLGDLYKYNNIGILPISKDGRTYEFCNVSEWLNMTKQLNKESEEFNANMDQFIRKIQDGEKIVIASCYVGPDNQGNWFSYQVFNHTVNSAHLLITNKANIYNNGKFIFNDFDIPSNYINIINMMITGYRFIPFTSIVGIIDYIKNDNYAKIVAENMALKEKYTQYLKDKEDLDKQKSEFEEYLTTKKEKIKLIAAKLELTKASLEKQKQKINEIRLTDLDD
jgi:hypothetical protein